MAGAAPLRVLIVDDSPDDAELTELALRDGGLAVEVRRAHGEAGVTGLLRDFRPQLVLSDVNLPGFSGAEAMAMARAALPGVPVVFLTGSSIGAPGETLPEGDGLLLKDDLDRLPDLLRGLLGR
ncbi:response regulator [Luteimonas sp. XNQY3]|nr:response regulator [Luteimonas sp. XNQY3]MCD9004643.1 response regulator [Luteimonas sp. XNQY3]